MWKIYEETNKDLLDLALQDKREEEVEEVDVADNIGLR